MLCVRMQKVSCWCKYKGGTPVNRDYGSTTVQRDFPVHHCRSMLLLLSFQPKLQQTANAVHPHSPLAHTALRLLTLCTEV